MTLCVHSRITLGLAACCCLGSALPAPAAAQEIPRDKYLRFVPLEQLRLFRESPATERFQLYGDPAAPGYTDEVPRDGIGDTRERWLQALAVRFAPYLVRNTEERPLDFHRVYLRQQGGDCWSIAGTSRWQRRLWSSPIRST